MPMSPEQLKKMTNEIVDALTSDEFMGRMRALRKVSAEERIEMAEKLLNVEALGAAGVDLPEGMRVSSRYFEEDVGTFEFGNVDIVGEIKRLDSSFLESLKVNKPELYKKLVTTSFSTTASIACAEKFEGTTIMGTCGGGGAFSVCACGGNC